ncbi:MAG: hypothetical protein ACYTFG_05420 [Planctomycetota bacterium]
MYFLFVIGYVYCCGFTGRRDVLPWICMASMGFEALVLPLWRGRWTVTLMQERNGDGKSLFGRFLPRRFWPFVIPFFGVVSMMGVLIVAGRQFL